jgi:hypothetical protein
MKTSIHVILIPYIDRLNLNDRKYTLDNLKQMVNEFNDNGFMYGENGIPTTFDVNLSNVSFVVTDVFIKNNQLHGNIKILNSIPGKTLKEQIKSVIIRTKSTGKIDINGNVILSKLHGFYAIDKKEDSFNDKFEIRKKKLQSL